MHTPELIPGQMEPHPEIPEGINVSRRHPLADFGLMVVGVAIIVAAVVGGAHLLSGILAQYISFETEQQLFEQMGGFEAIRPVDTVIEDTDRRTQAYLQQLAERLAAHMDLPAGMGVQVHYDAADVANAYATLGGNIVIYQGLIDEVSSENALAMVMAHEIAHIKHRHPVIALGRSVVALSALASISGMADSGRIGGIVDLTGASLLSGFSRDQEEVADADAVRALLALYGHLGGADEFFRSMADAQPDTGMALFSTHPMTEDRLGRIESVAERLLGQARAKVRLPTWLQNGSLAEIPDASL